MLTQARLKKVFNYNPNTGVFTRLSPCTNSSITGHSGSFTYSGYISLSIDGKVYPAHRLVWLYVFGRLPSKHMDHINGVRSDNRLVNLRAVSPAVNAKNRKANSNNTSGFIGVNFNSPSGKWVSTIGVNGKSVYLGIFDNKVEAVKARANAEIKYGFHNNHGRLV